MADLEERARRRLPRGSDPAPCDWKACDAEATRELRFGRTETMPLPPALPPAARYCDEHADEVQALFFVDCDLVLEAAGAAA